MMTCDEMIAVIQHHKDGGKVEIFENKSWNKIVGDPSWNFRDCMYRPYIEPKQKKVIVLETWLIQTISEDDDSNECFFTVEANDMEMQLYFRGKYSSKAIKLLSTREVEID